MMAGHISARSRRRWGDNDKHLGPLTFAFRETWRPLSIVLSSASEERESPGCNIRFQAFGLTMICELPAVIKPWRRWVDTSRYHWAKPGDGYWDEHPREYGFTLSEGHLHVKLGAQTNDSSTQEDWGCFLPWTQWRQVAHRIYNADGSLVADVAGLPWDEHSAAVDRATRASFAIIDYDGERIDVETYVEERERRLGEGWFRWLGYIVPKRCSRSLDIRFKSEVGPEKGSWKGGMIGCGTEMLPGETQESAFRRFCSEEHRSKYRRYRMTFAERASRDTPTNAERGAGPEGEATNPPIGDSA